MKKSIRHSAFGIWGRTAVMPAQAGIPCGLIEEKNKGGADAL